MEQTLGKSAPIEPTAHNTAGGPPTKRHKTDHSATTEVPASLAQRESHQKLQLSRELVSKAAFLLQQAAVLRSGDRTILAHENAHRISGIFAQHVGNEVLRMHKQLEQVAAEQAKVEIMLEQIRRCNANPYPAWDSSQQIQPGLEKVGPLVELEGSYVMPHYADKSQMPRSPYMEHYRKWLVPAHCVPPKVVVERQAIPSSRRGTINSNTSAFGESMHATATAEAALPSVPELDPAVTKNSQGEWVRLQCWEYRKDGSCCNGTSDFKSVQGFINHRRIDHDIRHPTHREAADSCGTPMDLSEELRQAYEATCSKGRSKRSRINPGESAVKYDNDVPKRQPVPQTEVVDVIKLAPAGTKCAMKNNLDMGYVHVSTVHPFNKAGAKLPVASGYTRENTKMEVTSQDTQSSDETICVRRLPAARAVNAVVSNPDLPYLSQLLQAKSTKAIGGVTLDLRELVKETREAASAALEEISLDEADEE